jgi:hypothetical protein
MTTREPPLVTWVFRTALGEEAAPPPPAEWESALPALQASRLTTLAAHLAQSRVPALPPAVRAHFEAALLLGADRAERRRLQIGEVAASLERSGVDWMILKGWPLAVRLYPSPACRPSGDVDLLVSPAQRAAAQTVLEGLGYRVEGDDRGFHLRLVREGPVETGVLELHYRTVPPGMSGTPAEAVLARRRRWDTAAGVLWIPSPEDELDLLVRHYLRHAGDQAILLLDIAMLLEGKGVTHPLGALIAEDLSRLEPGRTWGIGGPRRWTQRTLRRWMMRRTFQERRAERHAALAGVPLALASSPWHAALALLRVAWPDHPTPRWLAASRTGTGRYTWRLKRLVRLGR